MLRLVIDGEEDWDRVAEVFVYPNRRVVKLEHSLVALSKWEAIHEKPFLDDNEKTNEEMISYIECMMLDEEDPSEVIPLLTQDNVNCILFINGHV